MKRHLAPWSATPCRIVSSSSCRHSSLGVWAVMLGECSPASRPNAPRAAATLVPNAFWKLWKPAGPSERSPAAPATAPALRWPIAGTQPSGRPRAWVGAPPSGAWMGWPASRVRRWIDPTGGSPRSADGAPGGGRAAWYLEPTCSACSSACSSAAVTGLGIACSACSSALLVLTGVSAFLRRFASSSRRESFATRSRSTAGKGEPGGGIGAPAAGCTPAGSAALAATARCGSSVVPEGYVYAVPPAAMPPPCTCCCCICICCCCIICCCWPACAAGAAGGAAALGHGLTSGESVRPTRKMTSPPGATSPSSAHGMRARPGSFGSIGPRSSRSTTSFGPSHSNFWLTMRCAGHEAPWRGSFHTPDPRWFAGESAGSRTTSTRDAGTATPRLRHWPQNRCRNVQNGGSVRVHAEDPTPISWPQHLPPGGFRLPVSVAMGDGAGGRGDVDGGVASSAVRARL
mmetsp:Transcript_35583/g.107201  ORF Transcript_35583/g.107201 Transcript_35583/m.107201 type:complete len:459 (-) Transcript_35583:149-1525(-)